MSKRGMSLPQTKAALERLARSVARLESAVATHGGGDARLADELAAARAEYVALQDVVESVSARLDGAIARLQTSLED